MPTGAFLWVKIKKQLNNQAMQFSKTLLAVLITGTVLTGCEIPKKPDFRTSQKIEAPILFEKSFQFMGDSTALIDTTSSSFDSLFTVDGDNFISLGKEQDFDFGDLNDAIPIVNADPASFSSAVGEIELGAFSSGGGNLGTANFQELTGQNPNLVPAGTPIIAGTTPSPVEIAIGDNTDYFVSATVKSGALTIGVTNNLGFDISTIDVVLFSGTTQVGSVTLNNVDHGQTTSDDIVFAEGDVLSNINVEVSVAWNAQTTKANPGELIVENAEGKNLIASEVEAVIEAQTFKTKNVTKIDSADFRFDKPEHYIELKSGEIDISAIQNSIDLTVDTLIISFPGIRTSPFGEGDSLVIKYNGATEITRNGNAPPRTVDLSQHRIYATNNQLTYNIYAKTENTQKGSGSQARVVTENDQVSSSISINNLNINRAKGNIATQTVLLNDDEDSDDQLALFNDNEAEITEIDGLSDLSKQLDNLEFTNPKLSISYTTNISVPTTIYGAFVGTSGSGKEVYLKGLSAEHKVEAADPISGLNKTAGNALIPDEMIKFSLEDNTDGNLIAAAIEFDKTNTNVDEFLNNLPNEIRFIGKAVINESGQEATIIDPLEFEPKISIDIPLAIETPQAASYTDTVKQDLGDVPSPEKGDSRKITQGVIVIDYINGLPLGFDLNIGLLDTLNQELFQIPASSDPAIVLSASEVDAVTKFASTPKEGSVRIALSENQLNQLYKTRFLEISADLQTTSNAEVKIRSTDTITLSVRADLTIETEVK